MLRLDVDGGTPYAIPPDNPFAGGRDVQRGPHTFPRTTVPRSTRGAFATRGAGASTRLATPIFGSATSAKGAFEEIDRVQRGGNYGWDCREGTSTFGSPAATCQRGVGVHRPCPSIRPRRSGFSVTGGYVYRGTALPALVGRYLFADYGSGRIWRLVSSGGGFTVGGAARYLSVDRVVRRKVTTASSTSSISRAAALHKIVAGRGRRSAGVRPCRRCSRRPAAWNRAESGAAGQRARSVRACRAVLVRQRDEGTLARDSERHVDRCRQRRRLQLPERHGADEALPPERQLIETRLFMRHPDGDWAGYTYEWNAQRTDATLVQGGKTVSRRRRRTGSFRAATTA